MMESLCILYPVSRVIMFAKPEGDSTGWKLASMQPRCKMLPSPQGCLLFSMCRNAPFPLLCLTSSWSLQTSNLFSVLIMLAFPKYYIQKLYVGSWQYLAIAWKVGFLKLNSLGWSHNLFGGVWWEREHGFLKGSCPALVLFPWTFNERERVHPWEKVLGEVFLSWLLLVFLACKPPASAPGLGYVRKLKIKARNSH